MALQDSASPFPTRKLLSPSGFALRRGEVHSGSQHHCQPRGNSCGPQYRHCRVCLPLLPHARSIQGRPVAILGSGGASLAAIEAFRTLFMPSEITLFMRNPAKETRMTDPAIKRCALGDLRESGSESSALLRDAAVVINATPVGTLGRPDAHMSPVPAESNLLHQGRSSTTWSTIRLTPPFSLPPEKPEP